MGLSSDGSVVFSSCCSGGVGVVVTLDGGGGGGQTLDLVMGDPRPASLALDLGARVLVGLPCTLTWILDVRLGAVLLDWGLSTNMTSTGSSLFASSAMVTPSPPSLKLGDEDTVHLGATG
jgi:hypothetical protein